MSFQTCKNTINVICDRTTTFSQRPWLARLCCSNRGTSLVKWTLIFRQLAIVSLLVWFTSLIPLMGSWNNALIGGDEPCQKNWTKLLLIRCYLYIRVVIFPKIIFHLSYPFQCQNIFAQKFEFWKDKFGAVHKLRWQARGRVLSKCQR